MKKEITKKYNRGSEWRKWDLHVHTPYSINQQYGGESKFDEFINELEKLPQEVKVLGINDYYFVDGYEKVIEEKLTNNRLNNLEKIFLVLEFRIDTFGNGNENKLQKVNLHILFDIDESNYKSEIKAIKEEFLSQIIVSNGSIEKNLGQGKQAFIDLSGTSNLQDGFSNIIPKTVQVLGELAKDKWKNRVFLFLGYKEWNNLEKNNQIKPIKEELAKKVQGFFTAGSDKYADKKEIINKFVSNAPLLHSQDIHDFETLKKHNCETWIKADPTFEGLKQIIYEPEDRVKIQELKPEEKNVYETIDKVKFIDDSFTPNEIFINQNLTAIIGGKSTGKSILLRNIAQTIDSKEVSKRLEEVNLPEYKEEVASFQVTWKDEQENKKNEDTGVNKKIIYIPQSYLNRLVDKKEDKTSIDDIIKNVLEQEEDVKNVFTLLQNQNRDVEKNITQNIEELFYKENDIKNLSESIKKIGDKKGIGLEIEKLKKEVSELKKKSGMTEDELRQYDELISESVKLKDKKELYQKDLKILEGIKDQKIFTSPFLDNLSEELQKNLKNEFFAIKEKYQSEWTNKLNEEITTIQKNDLENDKRIRENDKKLNPLVTKVVESKSLNEKNKKLEDEEQKLKEIIDQEKNLKTLKTTYISLIKNIAENHSKFFDNFFNAKTKILEQRSITEDQDLEFGIEILFESKAFQENCINDICDQRKLSKFEEVVLQDYSFSNSTSLKADMEKIIQAILSEKLTLKNSYSKKEAITRLTQDWFTFDYKIKQNGDEISEMSPGKKSFVLLKLLIELDNSKCPILLDQPEDDLDNRSIYNDLVKFIKTKKKERQIIIATHNPNLVVGADSECIIVANQSGDKSKNRTYQFEYLQGSLENTFLNESSEYILEQRGVQEHVCDILEGGKIAFEQRKKKYSFT
jgi:ABC-type cobalamin/Fe3+-siderophores transport system ATPase subunit